MFLWEVWRRFVEQVLDRSSGPMSFRFLLQPMLSTALAIRAGRKDAEEGQPPYLWSIFSDSSARRWLIHSGWQDAGRLFIMAFALDTLYQLIVLRWFYPVEALFVAALLAIVPYAIVRG